MPDGPRRDPEPEPVEMSAVSGRLSRFMGRLRRPFALAAPIVAGALVIIGGGEAWEGGVATVLVFAVIAYRAARWAAREAREDFFASYADSRGLERHGDEVPPAVTPLLRMGDRRYAERVMTGVLPGGMDGALAHYTYENLSANGDEDAHAFTIAIFKIPGVIERAVELYCEPRSSGSSSGIDGFRRANRLRLESVALDSRHEIFFGPGDDENWLHQLHAPTFIVWLSEQAPRDLGFQLSNGYLCAFVPGHRESADSLDGLCEAAAVVVRRLVEEAAE